MNVELTPSEIMTLFQATVFEANRLEALAPAKVRPTEVAEAKDLVEKFAELVRKTTVCPECDDLGFVRVGGGENLRTYTCSMITRSWHKRSDF